MRRVPDCAVRGAKVELAGGGEEGEGRGGREEVLVVAPDAAEPAREGRRDGRPGVNADRGREVAVEERDIGDLDVGRGLARRQVEAQVGRRRRRRGRIGARPGPRAGPRTLVALGLDRVGVEGAGALEHGVVEVAADPQVDDLGRRRDAGVGPAAALKAAAEPVRLLYGLDEARLFEGVEEAALDGREGRVDALWLVREARVGPALVPAGARVRVSGCRLVERAVRDEDGREEEGDVSLWGVGERGRERLAVVEEGGFAGALAGEEGLEWCGWPSRLVARSCRGGSRGGCGVELGEAVLEVGDLLYEFCALRIVWLGHG